MTSSSKEDYLHTMYQLYEKQEDKIKYGFRVSEISKKMHVSKASTSEMMKKMEKAGYVKVRPYSNIFLTKKGFKEAEKIMWKHRVIEVFLEKILKCKTNEIHREAHKLEHAFSDKLIEKLFLFLNKPKKTGKGKTIPKRRKK